MNELNDFVDSEDYVQEFEEKVESMTFPNPDPELIPELTKARFIAEQSSDEYSERIHELYEQVMQPLNNYEVMMFLITTLEEETESMDDLTDQEVEELTEMTRFDDLEQYEETDPSKLLTELTEREQTFFDYPAPPLHFVEQSVQEGFKELQADHIEVESEYLEHKWTVEAAVVGGRKIANEIYNDSIEHVYEKRSVQEELNDVEYETRNEYIDTVVFNVSLAVESMMREEGEIIKAP